MVKKIIFLIIPVLFANQLVTAQKIGIGASGIYNFQTKGLAYGIRLHYQMAPRWAIVPQYTRYISSNPVFEMYLGANLHYTITLTSPRIYLLAGLSYNNWYNYREFNNDKAKQNNLAEEIGAGLQFGRCCFRPFLEFRYNANWGEGAAHLGFVYFFGKCCDKRKKGGSGSGGGGKKRYGGGKGRGYCPAYYD
ncbi:MAG TPA: hypothetical protein EYP69_02340 [Bacteroidales bacterium]|nr:hypothetical protein [Bacteroidales bacterium]